MSIFYSQSLYKNIKKLYENVLTSRRERDIIVSGVKKNIKIIYENITSINFI